METSSVVWLLIAAAVIILILKCIEIAFDENRKIRTTLSSGNLPPRKDVIGTFYKKQRFFSESEYIFYTELLRQLPNQYTIFANVRLADIVRVKHARGLGYILKRNKILPRHADFIICNEAFEIIVAIELNGKSHGTIRQKSSDSIKRAVLDEAGVPLEIVEVGSNFSNEIARICSAYELR